MNDMPSLWAGVYSDWGQKNAHDQTAYISALLTTIKDATIF
jgi:hypothetical protein